MTAEQISEILDLCRLNQPAWWEMVKDLPTDQDRLDGIVMIGVREYEAQGGEPQFSVKN